MAANGVKITTVDAASIADDILALREGSAVRQSFANLANQLAGSGAVSTRLSRAEVMSGYGAIYKVSRAGLADIADPVDGQGAWVVTTTAAGKKGIYAYSEAVSDWVWIADLPISMSLLTGVGGTANAITASTLTGPEPSDIRGLLLVPLYDNDDAVTLELDDADPAPLLSPGGAPLTEGALAANVPTVILSDGTNLRIMFPADVVGQVEALRDEINDLKVATVAAKEAAETAAASSVDNSSGLITNGTFLSGDSKGWTGLDSVVLSSSVAPLAGLPGADNVGVLSVAATEKVALGKAFAVSGGETFDLEAFTANSHTTHGEAGTANADKMVIVTSGQSNNTGHSDSYGGPFRTVSNVTLWDASAGEFRTADLENDIFYQTNNTTGPVYNSTGIGGGRQNAGVAFGQRLYDETGRDQAVIVTGQEGQGLDEWVGSGTSSRLYAAMKADIENALADIGQTTIDYFVYQGAENSAYSSTAAADFGTLLTQLEAESWWTASTIFVVGEPCPDWNGVNRERLVNSIATFAAANSNVYIASSFGLIGAKGSGVYIHFTAQSLIDLGYERYWDAITTLTTNADLTIGLRLYDGAGGSVTDLPVATAYADKTNLDVIGSSVVIPDTIGDDLRPVRSAKTYLKVAANASAAGSWYVTNIKAEQREEKGKAYDSVLGLFFRANSDNAADWYVSDDGGAHLNRLNHHDIEGRGGATLFGGRDQGLFLDEQYDRLLSVITGYDSTNGLWDVQILVMEDLMSPPAKLKRTIGPTAINSPTVAFDGGDVPAEQIWSSKLVEYGGDLYITTSVEYFTDALDKYGATIPQFRLYYAKCNDRERLTFDAPVAFDLQDGGVAITDGKIDARIHEVGGAVKLVTKDQYSKDIEIWTASALDGTFTLETTVTGWGLDVEAPCIIKVHNAGNQPVWRMFVDAYADGAYMYTDSEDFVTWSTPEIVKCPYMIRHGGLINLRGSKKRALVESWISEARMLRGSVSDGKLVEQINLTTAIADGDIDASAFEPREDVLYFVSGSNSVTLTIVGVRAKRFYLAALSQQAHAGITINYDATHLPGKYQTGIRVGYGKNNMEVVTMTATFGTSPLYLPSSQGGHFPVTFKANKNGVLQEITPANTYTKVTFANELYDRGGCYNAATSRFTPPPAEYDFKLRVMLSGTIAVGDALELHLYKNGVICDSKTERAAAAGSQTVDFCVEDRANGTDYYEVYVRAPGVVNVLGGTSNTSFSASVK
ncbi:sialate O-acetylesterase [uncultured Cohaesibacter sp.]|uniref:sialate O-acetylesterase n=1 Tax=uncultured Cohaesibacter sp. TaxID=1002546 RepID=UPI0029C99FD7|nr:sialate O-acetylesterase [uncultured Cohaesibacter sp.]